MSVLLILFISLRQAYFIHLYLIVLFIESVRFQEIGLGALWTAPLVGSMLVTSNERVASAVPALRELINFMRYSFLPLISKLTVPELFLLAAGIDATE